MPDRKMTNEEWDEIERASSSSRRPRVYSSRVCILCGRTIREGAFGGLDSNWKKHVKACEKRKAEEN